MTLSIFPIVCACIASYFAVAVLANVGFPPRNMASRNNLVSLAMFVFFVVLPYAQRVEFFQFFSYEARPFEQVAR